MAAPLSAREIATVGYGDAATAEWPDRATGDRFSEIIIRLFRQRYGLDVGGPI